jgi:hypothetical protein
LGAEVTCYFKGYRVVGAVGADREDDVTHSDEDRNDGNDIAVYVTPPSKVKNRLPKRKPPRALNDLSSSCLRFVYISSAQTNEMMHFNSRTVTDLAFGKSSELTSMGFTHFPPQLTFLGFQSGKAFRKDFMQHLKSVHTPENPERSNGTSYGSSSNWSALFQQPQLLLELIIPPLD